MIPHREATFAARVGAVVLPGLLIATGYALATGHPFIALACVAFPAWWIIQLLRGR